MLITIYDSVGNPKVDLSPNDSSTQVKEVQGDSVLTLSFTHYEHIELDVDDYADFLGERFWLTEKYRPRQNSKMEWVYDIKLYGVESMIKRLLVIKTVDNEDDPVFTLTAPPRDHVAMIVKCMNDGMGNITDWKVGQVNGTENIVIDYFGKYCDEALKEIAEKVGAEWWVEGQTVNICKCEHGEPIPMGYDKGLLSIDLGTADNVKFYTRLYPVGSSRNIDREKYGFSRLQLPGGQKYVEINADKYGRVDHFEQSAFEGIYPRRVGSVSSVRSEVKTGEDGNPFTIYYFTDNSLPFDPNDYKISGLVIRVSFQEGSELAGLGDEEDGTYFFEVNFNSSTREFEIITIWPYGNDMQLPGDKLIPKAGDKYILWNLRMPDEYYALAEEEFLTAVNKYNADHNLDISVYKAPTDHVWIEDNNVELTIGRRVRLESEEYFPSFGFRDSRITKITRKVNLPSSMDIEISDALSRTSQEKMSDSIADVRSYARSIEASISLPDIIRTGDRTFPTDNNLFSARRSQKEFLSKVKDDRSAGKIASDRGFEAGRYVRGLAGGFIDDHGDADLGHARLRDGAHFGDFVAGLYAGTGAGVDRDGNMEVQSLRVRSYLEVLELLVNRLSAIEGDQLLTEADTIERVVHIEGDVYGLYLRPKWEGYFTAISEGSVLKGIINTLAQGSGTYYTAWSRVNSVNTALNYIEVSMYPDSEVPGGRNFPPCEMMNVARWGHQTDPRRQSCIYLSSTEGRIVRLTAVTRPIIDKSNYGLVLGEIPDGLVDDPNIIPGRDYLFAQGIITNQIIHVDRTGRPVATLVDCGPWQQDGKYRFETVNPDTDILETSTAWHYGCRWKCMLDGTTDEPTYKSTAWAFLEGNPYFTVRFDAGDHVVIDPDDFRLPLNIIAELYNRDVTADVADTDVEWSRYSEDAEGNPRTASDNAWAIAHAAAGKGLTLTPADLDLNGTGLPRTMVFRATVRFRDGHTSTADFAYL